MISLLHLILALVLSSTACGLLTWGCRRTGFFLDQPDARKVHGTPVPRCGGIAVFLGTVVPLLPLLADSRIIAGYAAGGTILALFGVVDDYRGLDFRLKFLGQISACVAMMHISGLSLTNLGEVLPGVQATLGPLAPACTVFLLVAIINAINFSDGLDGLAGGISLLILTSTALLSFLSENNPVLVITLCSVGGIIGFLRLNVHPALIFMGDTGSQFLGYTIGTCLIGLNQGDSIYSPLLPLFLLGTPLVDMTVVICIRLLKGVSIFRPDKSHLHHRLLGLGFSHAQCVLIIYGVNLCLLITGIGQRFARDYWILAGFLTVIASSMCVGLLLDFRDGLQDRIATAFKRIFDRPYFLSLPRAIIDRTAGFTKKLFLGSLAALFLTAPLFVQHKQAFIGWAALGMALLLLGVFITNRQYYESIIGICVYMVLLYTVYAFSSTETPDSDLSRLMNILYGLLAVSYCGYAVLSSEHVPLNWISLLLLATAGIALATPLTDAQPVLQTALPKVLLIGLSVNMLQTLLTGRFMHRYLLGGCIYSYLAIFARNMG